MKPPPFSYHDPRTVGDAVALLGRLDNAKLLAGGQSMMPMLNMRFVQPDHIIDLNKVEGLSYIREAQRRARDRRHDAPARHRILRPGAQALPADARGDPACRPPPDPQPRHHRRLALPSRSLGRAGDRRRGDGRDRDGAGAERHAQDRIRRVPGRLHDAGDRTERAGDGGALSAVAGRPRLRLRRVLAPARRLRHRRRRRRC